MEYFDSEAAWLEHLRAHSSLPQGFQAAVGNLAFVPAERPSEKPYSMNLALIRADSPLESFAGVFTRNKMPGAPVLVARERMQQPCVSGVLVNNRISNVCSPTGIADIGRLTDELARLCGGTAEEYLSASTGIIGWSLPIDAMVGALPALQQQLGRADGLDVARAIMTTDSFPKLRAARCGEARVVGIAKGAGMIEPNLATMLVFFLTDATLERGRLRAMLPRVAEQTFNCISIDGDQSTSDMVLALSSGVYPVAEDEFESCLTALAAQLAQDIVRNGEGTEHVIRVRVHGVAGAREASALAKAVVNSPLVKTAVYGNDPNVGRIIGALGDCAGNCDIALDPRTVRLSIGTEEVFAGGVFRLDKEKENRLCSYLKQAAFDPDRCGFPQHERTVDIDIQLGAGAAEATVYGSDLSHGYVTENADYRT